MIFKTQIVKADCNSIRPGACANLGREPESLPENLESREIRFPKSEESGRRWICSQAMFTGYAH